MVVVPKLNLWERLIRLLILPGLILLYCTGAGDTGSKEKKGLSSDLTIQFPVVAGSFYPDDVSELEVMVKKYIDGAKVPDLKGRPIGFMVPHAGYIYSGPVAGYVYRALKGRKVSRIVILAPSHYFRRNVVSALDKDIYRTPLCDLKIDRKIVKSLMDKSPLFTYSPEFYLKEHSLEVQLPFLCKVLPDIPIVPLILGDNTPSFALEVAKVLKEVIGMEDVVYLASSDMSHYYPYDVAVEMDKYTLELIEAMDTRRLYSEMMKEKAQLCGGGPVLTLMTLMNLSGGADVIPLNLRNSGDTAGGKGRVVGYGAVAFVSKKGDKAMSNKKENKEYLTIQDKKELLHIARKTIESYIRHRKIPDFDTDSEILKKDGAAFVTLEKKGHLRGCIGQLKATQPLYLCVRDMAVSASSRDPRFPPVSIDELKDIEVEISVLTPMKPVKDINEIEVGRHGLYITKGFYSGVLLPQVATENGWTREEFLKHTCEKAGLPSDCWKKGANIYSFEAIVFSEREIEKEG